MNTKSLDKISLINGTFEPDEALDILLSTLDFKINFHQVRILREMERSGGTHPVSVQRLRELRIEREKVEKVIALVKESGGKVGIKADFEILMERPKALSN
jgi:hypothetical protein